MERLQIPFKNWVEKMILPKYKKYLQSTSKNKSAEEYYQVANIFFHRAMQIGFINLNEIRKDFIQKEFLYWWPTHVLLSNLNKEQVRLLLKELFIFLELVYNVDIKKFGF